MFTNFISILDGSPVSGFIEIALPTALGSGNKKRTPGFLTALGFGRETGTVCCRTSGNTGCFMARRCFLQLDCSSC